MLRQSLIVLVAAAVTLGLAQPAMADDAETVTASETMQALASVPGVLASSDAVQTVSDANSAATSTVAGTTVDTPRDASDGVTLQSGDGPAVKIELPGADNAVTGSVVAPGTVAYPASNGSANAVQATEDGGVRMLTVIGSADAPEAYTYKVDVPGGGHIELVDGGGGSVYDATGNVVATVDVPWAKDATGQPVSTYYTTDGTTLVQHVAISTAGISFPVTADPSIFPPRIDRVVRVNTPRGVSYHVYVSWYGYVTSFVNRSAAFNEAMQKGRFGFSWSLYNQFVCHADWAPPFKESWNLDTWRPDVGYWRTVAALCNP